MTRPRTPRCTASPPDNERLRPRTPISRCKERCRCRPCTWNRSRDSPRPGEGARRHTHLRSWRSRWSRRPTPPRLGRPSLARRSCFRHPTSNRRCRCCRCHQCHRCRRSWKSPASPPSPRCRASTPPPAEDRPQLEFASSPRLKGIASGGSRPHNRGPQRHDPPSRRGGRKLGPGPPKTPE